MKICKYCKLPMIHGTSYVLNGSGDFYECPKCHDRFQGRIIKQNSQEDHINKNGGFVKI